MMPNRNPDREPEPGIPREIVSRWAAFVPQRSRLRSWRDYALGPTATNVAETRRLLAREVYGVPESLLDDVIRVRLADLERD